MGDPSLLCGRSERPETEKEASGWGLRTAHRWARQQSRSEVAEGPNLTVRPIAVPGMPKTPLLPRIFWCVRYNTGYYALLLSPYRRRGKSSSVHAARRAMGDGLIPDRSDAFVGNDIAITGRLDVYASACPVETLWHRHSPALARLCRRRCVACRSRATTAKPAGSHGVWAMYVPLWCEVQPAYVHCHQQVCTYLRKHSTLRTRTVP